MALAAKRRRLSQADSLPPSDVPPSLPQLAGSESNKSVGVVKRGRGRPRKQPIRISPQTSLSAQESQTAPHSPPQVQEPPSSPTLDPVATNLPPEPSEPQKIWSPSGGKIATDILFGI